MAAGSTAALQMQKNMAAAPYVQQEAAASAEETQLKLQQDRLKAMYAPQQMALKMQEDQAIVERNRINEMVTKTNLQLDKDAKAKIQTVMQTDEFKNADDIKRAKLLNQAQLEVTGDPEKYFKNNQGIELAAQRETKVKQQEADLNAQNLTRALSNINSIPKEQLGNYIDNLPESVTKAAIAGVGNANWEKFTPEQKRDALAGQMHSAAAQLVEQKIEGAKETQKVVAKSKKEIAAAHDAAKIIAKTIGVEDPANKNTRLEVSVGKLYAEEERRIDSTVKPSIERNNSLLSSLKEKATHEKFVDGKVKPETTAEVDRVTKELAALEKKRNDALTKVVERLPASEYKNKLMREHNLIDAAVSPPPKPDAKPADTPTVPSNKPPAKLTQEQTNEAISKANKAIEAGADPAKVKARLKELGVSFKE
jgi:hypothetical protein